MLRKTKDFPKKAKDFKDLHLKNPKDTSVNETKEIILNLRRIWGEVPAENPKISKEKITKKSK